MMHEKPFSQEQVDSLEIILNHKGHTHPDTRPESLTREQMHEAQPSLKQKTFSQYEIDSMEVPVQAHHKGHTHPDKSPNPETECQFTQPISTHLDRNFEEVLEKMNKIRKAKNSDYTGADANPYKNFQAVEELGVTSVEVGFLTRMTDKLCRITSLTRKGSREVKDESIEDTLMDMANYSVLMLCYLRYKRDNEVRR